eukprot:1160858-Pelagomonas_calceolata.AAC.14
MVWRVRPLKDGYIDRGAVAWRPQAGSWARCLRVFGLHEMDVPLFWRELTVKKAQKQRTIPYNAQGKTRDVCSGSASPFYQQMTTQASPEELRPHQAIHSYPFGSILHQSRFPLKLILVWAFFNSVIYITVCSKTKQYSGGPEADISMCKFGCKCPGTGSKELVYRCRDCVGHAKSNNPRRCKFMHQPVCTGPWERKHRMQEMASVVKKWLSGPNTW